MGNIVGIAGFARGGKTTSINYIFGCELLSKGIIKRFDIGDDGELLVNALFYNDDGNPYEEMAKLDIDNRSQEFVDFMDAHVYQFIKNYNFADILKGIAIELYGIRHEQVYGSTDDKNSDTQYTWADFLEIIPKRYRPKTCIPENKVKARQFLQYLGDALRHINDSCFTDPTIRKILYEQPSLSIIGDVRQEMEVDKIHEAGGKVIFLTRKTQEDTHRTEKELELIDRIKFDAVIDNQNMTIEQRNKEIYQVMSGWGLIN